MIGTVVVPVLVIVALVIVNGVFVAAEFSLVAARRSRLQTVAEGGSRAARWLVDVFDRPMGKDRYIAIAQLGITLASIGLGMYGEPAVAGWLYGPFEDRGLSSAAAHTVGFVVALSGITYMHVVFGEMIPKALALQAPEAVSLRVNPVMRVFGMLFRPMVAVLNATALVLMHLLRIPEPDQRLALYTSAELAIVTDEAADSGQLGALQRDLIRNIFELDELTAEELMTARGRVEVLAVSSTPDDVAARIAASPRSRYPVVDGDLDHVVGILHIKDFIRAEQHGLPLDVAELARPVTTVSGGASGEQLLEQFKRDRMHASLVVDELGSTTGFVTLDDIIAEVMEEHGAPARRMDLRLPGGGGAFLGSFRDSDADDRHLAHEDTADVLADVSPEDVVDALGQLFEGSLEYVGLNGEDGWIQAADTRGGYVLERSVAGDDVVQYPVALSSEQVRDAFLAYFGGDLDAGLDWSAASVIVEQERKRG